MTVSKSCWIVDMNPKGCVQDTVTQVILGLLCFISHSALRLNESVSLQYSKTDGTKAVFLASSFVRGSLWQHHSRQLSSFGKQRMSSMMRIATERNVQGYSPRRPLAMAAKQILNLCFNLPLRLHRQSSSSCHSFRTIIPDATVILDSRCRVSRILQFISQRLWTHWSTGFMIGTTCCAVGTNLNFKKVWISTAFLSVFILRSPFGRELAISRSLFASTHHNLADIDGPWKVSLESWRIGITLWVHFWWAEVFVTNNIGSGFNLNSWSGEFVSCHTPQPMEWLVILEARLRVASG